MKKFISMVMAAAMVVSLVPATAFADTGSAKAVAKVIDAADIKKNDPVTALKGTNVELQLKVDGDGQYADGSTAKHELTFTLDGAEFKYAAKTQGQSEEDYQNAKNAAVKKFVKTAKGTTNSALVDGDVAITEAEKDSFKMTINQKLKDDDVISLKLGMAGVDNILELKSTSVDKKATISVDGDLVKTDDLTFAEVKDTGIKATVKKVAEVAEEGIAPLEKDLKIEANVGTFKKDQEFTLKLSNGFEFNKLVDGTNYTVVDAGKGEKEATIKVTAGDGGNNEVDTITIKAADMVISAESAKVGAECKLTVKAVKTVTGTFSDTADAVVVAKVVADEIKVSVDEDEDLPVIYSGVDVKNNGITDDSDHEALEVTIEEPTAGSLDAKKELTMELPDGVYVTNVTFGDKDFIKSTDSADDIFKAAYKKGDYETFKFARRVLEATEEGEDAGKLEFTLTLVAEPGFTGDVTLKVEGAGMDKAQEVKIAKFVSPYTVEASQNDLIIDYRNTKVPTNIVVKEAEEGLWKKDSEFKFKVEKFKDNDFENDATYKEDDKSGLEVKTIKNKLGFKVDKESSDAAAAVTISDISLYMSRYLAAGAYDLQLNTTGSDYFMAQYVYGVPAPTGGAKDERSVAYQYYNNEDSFDHTVKEGFINIITAGRDQDDASFTKKVVVPVGEKYLIAGEEQVALDVPAYISAQGYTMLPVRAVATALGINNNNVLWNQASRTVTILYGQRIITMVAGQKVVTVNGNTIPASATVQIKDGRTFLPMRDLATALGVTDITWDAATKTATMNGNQNK
nr:copper amine oxidase N-terminal domain-containing protein [uncultured Anaerotignum sp.]